MALIDPAPIDIRIKELHGKKILITMCLFWLEARFAFCDSYTTYEATYDLKLTDNEIFAKNRSTKRYNFLRIFAEVQWSITQSQLQ